MSDLVIVALIAAVPGTISAVIGLHNRQQLKELTINVNGRLSQLLESAGKVGQLKERDEHRAAQDKAHE